MTKFFKKCNIYDMYQKIYLSLKYINGSKEAPLKASLQYKTHKQIWFQIVPHNST